jgi:serine/threonine protein kinase
VSDWGLAPENTEPVPERLGRYELLLPVASGGVATVYLASSSGAAGFERHVAIKLTHPHLADSPSFFASLVDEARLAGRIHHPNVVGVLDVGLTPRGAFIVMDYVEGESLAVVQQILKHRGDRMPIGVALRILEDVAAGLHAAHELCDESGRPRDVVHRDVTPHNILIGTDGVARLTDFGVAKAESRLTKTSPGLVKGKVAYMSPEQAQGRALDRTCDIWALGVVAWELFTGARLYEALADPVVMLKIARQAPTRARHVRAELPRELDEVVGRALTMQPSERFPTAEAFAEALVEAARGAGVARAEAKEVRAFLLSLVGPKLDARREKATKIRELRRRLDAFDPATPHSPLFADEPTRVITARPSSPSKPELEPEPEPELAEALEPEQPAAESPTEPASPRPFVVLRQFGWRLMTAPLTSRGWLIASVLPALLVTLIWALTEADAERPSGVVRARVMGGAAAGVDAGHDGEPTPVLTPQDLALESQDEAGAGDAEGR